MKIKKLERKPDLYTVNLTVNSPNGVETDYNDISGRSLDEIIKSVQMFSPKWTSLVIIVAKRG